MRWPRSGYPKADSTGSAVAHTSRVMSCQASLSLSKMALILAVIESIAFDRQLGRRGKTTKRGRDTVRTGNFIMTVTDRRHV